MSHLKPRTLLARRSVIAQLACAMMASVLQNVKTQMTAADLAHVERVVARIFVLALALVLTVEYVLTGSVLNLSVKKIHLNLGKTARGCRLRHEVDACTVACEEPDVARCARRAVLGTRLVPIVVRALAAGCSSGRGRLSKDAQNARSTGADRGSQIKKSVDGRSAVRSHARRHRLAGASRACSWVAETSRRCSRD